MKRSLAALFAWPLIATAHPGHSAFDVTAGSPHSGHAGEYVLLLLPLLGLAYAALSSSRKPKD